MMRGWCVAVIVVILAFGSSVSPIVGQSRSQNADPVNAAPAGRLAGGPDSPAVISGCCSPGPLTIEATLARDVTFDIDGLADEAIWREAAIATDFVQFQPDEGAAATERTEARVVYGDDALYVYLIAHEADQDDIVGQLTRRDQDSYSDLLAVVIDSYFDKRTAFHFAVNPVGVKHDIYRFNDTQEDRGWDAVWDVATRRTPEGWAAEFKIPYSQLRVADLRSS